MFEDLVTIDREIYNKSLVCEIDLLNMPKISIYQICQKGQYIISINMKKKSQYALPDYHLLE